MNRLARKIAIVSHTFPPAASGTAMRLSRFFRDVHPDDYVLLSSASATPGDDHAGRLPGLCVQLDGTSAHGRLARLTAQLLRRARSIARHAREQRCGAVLACSGDLLDLPAAKLASRWCGLPLIAALDDDYAHQWTEPLDAAFARFTAPIVLRGAARVVVINEFLRDDLLQRYGVACDVVYNPAELPPLHREEAGSASVITYTGSIYHANADAFRNLLEAMKMLGRDGVQLHIYSAQRRADIEAYGIRGPVVFHGMVTAPQAMAAQQRADILFLPLAFRSGIDRVIRTSMPFKAGEYLASGRPVLVHAPRASYLTWYFRQNRCGVVVDEPDAGALLEALRGLLDDPVARGELARRGRETAERDFAIDVVVAQFHAILQAPTVS